MTKQTEEALKMAIKALDLYDYTGTQKESELYTKAIQACKEALAQPLTRDWKETINERIAKDDAFKQALEHPAQEPVALVIEDKLADWSKPYVAVKWNKVDFEIGTKFYTHPAPLWQGLSDDEILEIDKSIDPKISIGKGKTLFARAIEQALKEKNTC